MQVFAFQLTMQSSFVGQRHLVTKLILSTIKVVQFQEPSREEVLQRRLLIGHQSFSGVRPRNHSGEVRRSRSFKRNVIKSSSASSLQVCASNICSTYPRFLQQKQGQCGDANEIRTNPCERCSLQKQAFGVISLHR